MGMLNLDAMLDSDLSAVEAAPNYITPENSICRLEVVDAKAEEKKSTKKEPGQPDSYVVLILQYGIVSVYEQEEGTMPMAPGSIFSDQFQFSDKGLPYFKTRAAEIISASGEDGAEVVNSTKMSAILLGLKGMQFDARIKKIQQRRDGVIIEGQFNTRLENIAAPRA
jgi:hypothetical protein